MFAKNLFPAFRMLLVLTVLTGLIYPLVITGIARVVFPAQASGSLETVGAEIVGSELIGQLTYTLDEEGSIANLNAINGYFWGRPSAVNYTLGSSPESLGVSSGTNYGSTNADLDALVNQRAIALRQAHNLAEDVVIPQDLLFASSSGLDPHISPEAARIQIDRVAEARDLDTTQVAALVDQYTESPQLAFLGQPRVNVLLLNLALDRIESE